eukprot:3983053-Pyramimonas_sp.AAC.1
MHRLIGFQNLLVSLLSASAFSRKLDRLARAPGSVLRGRKTCSCVLVAVLWGVLRPRGPTRTRKRCPGVFSHACRPRVIVRVLDARVVLAWPWGDFWTSSF